MDNQVEIINQNVKNGQTKCPKCGASDVYFNQKRQKIICNYCSHEFDPSVVEDKKNTEQLEGDVRGSATKDIDNNASDLVTIHCDGCGAEIVVNTIENLNTKCHWCGSSLSVNRQVDNGIVPDEILPFKLTKEQALGYMKNYVQDKLAFTTNDFKEGLTINNIRGVYMPYLVIDAKAHGSFKGVGNKKVKVHYIDDDSYYDVDVFRLQREFDLVVEGLTIESSMMRLDKYNVKQKNNVINAIMPFDTENCIQFNANYLDGFTSEKRDVDVHEIERKVHSEINDIARQKLKDSIAFCDGGVRWEYEGMKYDGKQWLSAYLPVWLYSYQDSHGVLHYVAVNGRTGETVGSIPFNKAKLASTIFGILAISFVLGLLVGFIMILFCVLIWFAGITTALILFIVEDYKYANMVWKRHHYEVETKCDIKYNNVINELMESLKMKSTYKLRNANENKVQGEFVAVEKNMK